MEDPIILQSRSGKPQLYHQGFTLSQNKKTKNNQTYFQCVHKHNSVRCAASATIVGPLEEGKFGLKFHHVHKHIHEPFKCDIDLKNFNTQFKAKCKKEIDKSIQKIYEDLKISFVSSLSQQDRVMFLERLPAMRSHLMQGRWYLLHQPRKMILSFLFNQIPYSKSVET